MVSELGLGVATGAAWMVGLRWAHRLVGVISVAFLARLLVPGDFGLVALATTVVAFLDLFGQTQMDVALIHDQGASRDLYDSAWTMEILRGAVLTLGSGGDRRAGCHVFLRASNIRQAVEGLAVVVTLGGMVLCGAAIYSGTMLIVWWLSGAGPGAERHIVHALVRTGPLRWLLGTSS